ncbi:HAD family hydrolase [Aeromonas caviae]
MKKIVIFDLDYTLVNTKACQPYMTTKFGRERIVDLIDSGEVATELYDSKIVNYFNNLKDKAIVLVLSDSPKSYCLSILKAHGFKIPREHVFGSAEKPLVEFDDILDTLDFLYPDEYDFDSILVVGDSAKDIYFSHHISSPSILATWGCTFDIKLIECWAKPTLRANNIAELKMHIDDFLRGEIDYIEHDFRNGYFVIDHDYTEYKIADKHIGYSKRYIPIKDKCTNKEDESVSFNIRFVVKRAKNVAKDDLEHNIKQPFYKQDGTFGHSLGFKSLLGIYIKEFYEWAQNIGLKGKTLFIPVPSSLPIECYHSFPMFFMCQCWTEWINDRKDLPYSATYTSLVDRWRPVTPSHLMKGARSIEHHLDSIGFFRSKDGRIKRDIENIIIIDDVVTSGSQMSAVATLIKSVQNVREDVNIYGYALAKTTHPNPAKNATFEDIVFELDQAVADD